MIGARRMKEEVFMWLKQTVKLYVPADCPQIVTLLESPPNNAALSLMNLSANRWSNKPALRSSGGRMELESYTRL